MAVHAVVAGIELTADEPLPEWRIIRIEGGVPILIPMQQFGVVAKTFREILLAETLDEGGVIQVGLPDKFRRGIKILFLFPVNGNLCFVVSAHRSLRPRLFG